MYLLTFLLILSLYSLGYPAYIFYYPIRSSPWKKVPVDSLYCPNSRATEEVDKLNPREVIFKMQDDHRELEHAEGDLCYGLTYQVKCDEGFFGQKFITKKIIQHEITFTDCLQEQRKRDIGTYVEPYFPAEKCTWMSTELNEKTFIELKQHRVSYDPYLNAYVDHLFPNGRCQQKNCETIHSNTLWTSSQEPKKSCSPFSPHTGIIYEDADGKGLYINYFVSEITPLTDACVMEYCGQIGLRLSNGIFLSFNVTYNLQSQAPVCPEGITISYYQIPDYLMSLETTWSEMKDMNECLEVLQRIRGHKSVTFHDLSFFEPKMGGTFKAWRINDGSLEESDATWKGIIRFNFSAENQIGMGQDNEPVYWLDWVKSGNSHYLSGFNGVHKDSLTNTIIIPQLELLKRRYADSILYKHKLREIPHPVIEIISQITSNLTLMTETDENTVDFTGWITKVWNNLWGKITFLVTVAVTLFILVTILLCICKRQSRKRSTKDDLKSNGSIQLNFPLQERNDRIILQKPRGWGELV